MLTGVLKRSDIANFSPDLASMLANGALKANPAPHATTIDLGQLNVHNVIEHDASLSRNDAALGDNSDFSPERWKEMLQIYADADGDMVTYKEASKAKATRVRLSKEQHEAIGAHIGYGLREVFLSYGETALLLKTLGKSGKVPLRHLRIFFGSCISGPSRSMLTKLRRATHAAHRRMGSTRGSRYKARTDRYDGGHDGSQSKQDV